ncbi:MAG: glycogen debranching enzyme GlgX, partial [Rhodobacteraceae bacterium]|nr:glycogen debranching enzyme GlgX [Paracoccaceae bacterium]
CGNTLNVSHPFVLRMVLVSLRFWVATMGVDSFLFELATTLCREYHGFDPNGGFFDALRQDPVLARVRMIAEPWDIGPGGYQLGAFPTEFSECNDRYRDTVRRYWRGDEHSTQELGARLLGSADMFDHKGRRSWVSVNFVAAHDGFTLADTTSYAHKHNNANQEANHDGHNANFSDNCGIEGVIEDTRIIAIRKRRIRNLLATLFLSQGTPMLLAGDELGNSQFGNNNAYCQDNETSWIDWKEMDSELLDFVSQLAAFRRAHPAVRQSRFLHGHRHPENSQKDVEWTDLSGRPLQWRDPGLSNFCLTVRYTGADEESDEVFIAFNRSAMRQEVTLPLLTGPGSWRRCLDTDQTGTIAGDHAESRLAPIAGDSVVAFVVEGEHNSE